MLRDKIFAGLGKGRSSIEVGVVEGIYQRTYRADIKIYRSNQYIKKAWISTSYAGNGFGFILPLAVGDIVLVAFVGGSVDVPVIIGRLFTEKTEPPDAGEDEVLLRHRSGTVIKIKADGSVILDADKTIIGGTEAAGLTLKEWLDQHAHPTGVGPSAPASTGAIGPSPYPTEVSG